MDGAKLKISAIVLTKDEAVSLPACLSSLSSFDEVIVVDSRSTDGTADIARALDARVVEFAWNGDYPKKKQWSLENAGVRNDWVLFVDADERPSSELVSELRTLDLERVPWAAADVELSYRFLGRYLRHGHRVRKRALVRASLCRFPIVDDLGATRMWEVEGHYQPTADGPVGRLRGPMLHDDPDPMFAYFDRHNRYSDWEAYVRLRTDAAKSLKTARRRGFGFVRMGRGAAFFVYSYFLRLGLLDGVAGFHYALAHAFYFWQVAVKIRDPNADFAQTAAEVSPCAQTHSAGATHNP